MNQPDPGTRRPELVIRAALGTGWGGSARVGFTESAILGLAGGVAGWSVAYFSLPLVLSPGAADLPQIMAVTIDGAVLLVTLGTSVPAALMFALMPVFHIALPKLPLAGALHGGARSITTGRESNRTRHFLVVSQRATGKSLGQLVREAVDEIYLKPQQEVTIPEGDPIWNYVGAGRSEESDISTRHDRYLYGTV